MFFKAVNKFSGAIDGWGKSETREQEEERWDMAQVDVEEISEDEFNYLRDSVEIHDELISFFANEKTNFSEDELWIASGYQQEWDNLPCDPEGASDEQDEAMEKLLHKITDEIWVSREDKEVKECRLDNGYFTETEKALLEEEIKEGRRLIRNENSASAESTFNVGLTRDEIARIRLFVFTEIKSLETSCIKWHERKRDEENYLAPNEWIDMRRYTIKKLAEMRGLADKLDKVYEGIKDDK